jgi:hypothetical protein
MSLDAYTTGKSAQQIVADCERAARFPGLHIDPATGLEPTAGNLPKAYAYRWLQDVLKEAYTLFDWPGTQKASTMQITSRSQTLPHDFWRLQYENGIILILDSDRHPMENCTRERFFGIMTDDSKPAEPNKFYIDRNKAGSLFVDPKPDKTYLAEIHYFALPPPLNSILDVPDFPYDGYLYWGLLERYYLDQDDQRLAMAVQKKAMLIAEIRGVAFDTREQDSASMWDTRFFRGMPLEYD